MSSVLHGHATVVPERPRWIDALRITEMWAGLAIFAMWVAVACTSVWGSDIVSNSGPGGSSTTVPSGVAVALFAVLGTVAVARHGLDHNKK
jgi:hypothetical protein